MFRTIIKNDEIIITDWGSTDYPIFKHTSQKVKIHHIDKDEFSRGYGLNQCAKFSTKKLLFFMDSDLLISDEYVKSIRHLSNNQVHFPIVNRLKQFSRKKKLARLSYGTCIIHKSNFIKTPKWPEYYRWGNEDVVFYEKIVDDFKVIRDISSINHMWHPPSDFKTEWVNTFTY